MATNQELLKQGVEHHQSGRLAEARALYEQVLATEPEQAQALNLLGVIESQADRREVAVELIRRAIAVEPKQAAFHENLGNVLAEMGRNTEAIAALDNAVALNPNQVSAHFNLGNALRNNDQLDEAIGAYTTAVGLAPGYAEAHCNRGIALSEKGELEDAMAAYATALRLKPDSVKAHSNYALLLLLRGDFRRGWVEHEWRIKNEPRGALGPFPQPRWDRQGLHGRTVVVHSEQGYGDNIQFVRYCPVLAQFCGTVIVLCPKELARLFRGVEGVSAVVCQERLLPAYDWRCALPSLAYVLGDLLPTIPAPTSYLHADPAAAGRWAARLGKDDGRLKVGVAWAGNRKHPNDRNRSIPPMALASLGGVEGVSFFSLQKGDRLADAPLPPELGLVDWTEELEDFADAAAFISALDVVITADTAAAHLAGALGKPAWVLLPFVPDWRWMLHREDSIWYPSVRLFRQIRAGDWAEAIERVRGALSELATGGGRRETE